MLNQNNSNFTKTLVSGDFLKVLEYIQKTKILKKTFFLDQGFGIGLK